MVMTFAQFQSEMSDYADSRAAGELDDALVSLDNAIAIRATLPDTVSIANGSTSLISTAQLLALRDALLADQVRASRAGRGRIIGAGVQHPSSSQGDV